MRLIDVNKLILHLNDYALQESPNDNESVEERRISEMVYRVIQNCIKVAEEQPTAYDVEAVDRQLRERLLESLNSANDEMIDNGHTMKWENFFGKKEAYEDAISIVRGKE